MRAIGGAALALVLAGTVAAQTAPTAPPLDDARLTIHTLVREDIFAGWLGNDMTRFAQGEANIDKLLASRPTQRAPLLAWKGGGQVYRAVVAREKGDAAGYRRMHAEAKATFAEALKLGPQDGGVLSIVGGSYGLFGDRLDPADRAAAWEQSYQAYNALWGLQGQIADRLPAHHRGELIAGLVQSAQRTGRTAELNQNLDKMLVLTKGTPYETAALAWKADPKSQAGTRLVCKNCHDDGRLQPTLSRLAAPKTS